MLVTGRQSPSEPTWTVSGGARSLRSRFPHFSAEHDASKPDSMQSNLDAQSTPIGSLLTRPSFSVSECPSNSVSALNCNTDGIPDECEGVESQGPGKVREEATRVARRRGSDRSVGARQTPAGPSRRGDQAVSGDSGRSSSGGAFVADNVTSAWSERSLRLRAAVRSAGSKRRRCASTIAGPWRSRMPLPGAVR